jgi:hypothetical protein
MVATVFAFSWRAKIADDIFSLFAEFVGIFENFQDAPMGNLSIRHIARLCHAFEY